MKTDPPVREIRRRLSWVEFHSPLSEGEMVALAVSRGGSTRSGPCPLIR
jgi:hypothetical protein